MLRAICVALLLSFTASGQATLYNGIRLPSGWPPRDVTLTNEPSADPPYLSRRDAARVDELIQARHFRPGKTTVSAAHLMGGCAMGRSAADSVTDAWGRVHGIPWLRVADSSLFPDSLEINPYVTIMALADRVAEKVRTEWGGVREAAVGA